MIRPNHGVRIEVPKAGQDRPELARVGVIATIGFAIGIVWPWLAGVRMVPEAPIEEPEAEPLASAAPSASRLAAAPSVQKQREAEAAPRRTEAQSVEIGEAQVISCRDEGQEKLEACDKLDFDTVAKPRLMALANCPAAQGSSKLMSIGFDVDFDKKKIGNISSGKSTTFSKEDAAAVVACAEKEFASATLDGVEHEHSRYSIYYFVDFIPPGTLLEPEEGSAEGDDLAEASGLATVTWDVALVRDAPEDGAIRTRLRYGTRVAVTARKGKWYQVKYDSKGSEGWVHKNAIGL